MERGTDEKNEEKKTAKFTWKPVFFFVFAFAFYDLQQG